MTWFLPMSAPENPAGRNPAVEVHHLKKYRQHLENT